MLEPLEPRMLLYSGAAAWNMPDLTLSFAPEGTDLAGHASELFSHFGEMDGQQAWQSTIVRAFTTWAQHLNASITVVEDSGDPFGVPGPSRGDSRFGDIRVGALPLSSDVIAMSVPHSEMISGTWAGDLLFNSNVDLASLDDLFSVALHEAGHVFGLGHTDDPNSPMYVHGASDAREPTPHDIEQLQKLYSGKVKVQDSKDSRTDEEHDIEDRQDHGLHGAGAVRVSPDSAQITRYETGGVIDSADDVDYFRLEPSGFDIEDLEYLSIVVRSTDPEDLVFNATVYDKEGKLLKSRVLAREAGLLVLQASDADPTEGLFVRVEPAQSHGTFWPGSYNLTAQFVPRQVKLNKITSGSLDSEKTTRVATLHVDQTRLFHFALTAKASKSKADVLTSVTLMDLSGKPVYHVEVRPGETRSARSVLLEPGDYRLEFQARTIDGTALPEISYKLWGDGVTVPIGPGILDPTESPVLPCGTSSAEPQYCNPVDLAVTDPVVLPDPYVNPAPSVVNRPPPEDLYW